MAGLVGLAIRRLTLVAASSGVAFGSVRAGAWGDGKDSRELLSQLKNSTDESLQTLRHGSSPTTKASILLLTQLNTILLQCRTGGTGLRFCVCVCVCVCVYVYVCLHCLSFLVRCNCWWRL